MPRPSHRHVTSLALLLSALVLLASTTAQAGYGDVTPDGYPNWGERVLHSWTNAVRVDPEAFRDEYEPCSFEDFEPEQQQPQQLLFFDLQLNEAGRFHTDDMQTSGVFSHTSSDGTSFFDRVQRYYGESMWIGENIAQGYGNAFDTIFRGWMCSEGHRYNIMLGEYNELGTGVLGNHYTQDFAAGIVDTTSPVAMAVHAPELPMGDVQFMADWSDTPPDHFDVVLNGVPIPLELTYGAAHLGVYTADALAMPGCHAYYFYWETDDRTGTFPESGSYLLGPCEQAVMWTAEQAPLDGSGSGGWEIADPKLRGCACTATNSVPSGIGWWALFGCLAARRRTGHRTDHKRADDTTSVRLHSSPHPSNRRSR
jgi:hypothetical protein